MKMGISVYLLNLREINYITGFLSLKFFIHMHLCVAY